MVQPGVKGYHGKVLASISTSPTEGTAGRLVVVVDAMFVGSSIQARTFSIRETVAVVIVRAWEDLDQMNAH